MENGKMHEALMPAGSSRVVLSKYEPSSEVEAGELTVL